ncbi:hypothetical protein SAMN04515665_10694 [Blastococcus sp. DSM 46786]|uniref:hypothetical protein n=1 Tax=Blastococcus sp. DSM 46786 TaxID=1798227 RepID=UPI0008B83976|nr:hypothetical protein [Blastococcus sp. DSM 46786]SEK90659.1 hypothetical protein SAMN04515665_10694 [Blastococcus sp. DSM 46786]
MASSRTHTSGGRAAVVALAAATGLMLTGCGEDEPAAEGSAENVLGDVAEDEAPEEEPEIPFDEIPGDELVEPAFDGLYDDEFLADIDSYLERPVVLSGEVADLLTDGVFAMTAADDPGIAPILVVTSDAVPEIADGVPVTVTGTLEDALEMGAVEQMPDFELDDPLFEQYAGAPFVFAETVEVSPAAG